MKGHTVNLLLWKLLQIDETVLDKRSVLKVFGILSNLALFRSNWQPSVGFQKQHSEPELEYAVSVCVVSVFNLDPFCIQNFF